MISKASKKKSNKYEPCSTLLEPFPYKEKILDFFKDMEKDMDKDREEEHKSEIEKLSKQEMVSILSYIEDNKEDEKIVLENGSSSYFYILGRYYKTKGDMITMAKYYKESVRKGNILAMHAMANYHKSMNEISSMLAYLKLASDMDDMNATMRLAMIFERVIEDSAKMIDYYKRAIKWGNVTAMNNLAHYYYMEDDIPSMLKYYNMAVKKNSNVAMYEIGMYYQEEENESKMIKYLKMAIAHGNTNAMFQMGLYYDKMKKFSLMKKFYEMAVEHGHSNAMCKLGLYYKFIHNDVQMLRYYTMAADVKSPRGMQLLGLYYQEKGDIPKMLDYYMMGVNEEDIDSICFGVIYFVEMNDLEGFLTWTEKCKNKNINKLCMESMVLTCIEYKNYNLFFNFYEKFEHHDIFQKFHMFYTHRKKYMQLDECVICMEKRDVFPYDCMGHMYCMMCYLNMDKCAMCNLCKNQEYINLFTIPEGYDEIFRQEEEEEDDWISSDSENDE